MSQLARGIKYGDWYAHCQRCAGRFFGSTMLVDWKNLFVCTDCFEEKHPQDDIPSRIDQRIPPRVSTTTFVGQNTLLAEPATAESSANWYGH